MVELAAIVILLVFGVQLLLYAVLFVFAALSKISAPKPKYSPPPIQRDWKKEPWSWKDEDLL